ncbi:MAG: hypothetical protein AAB434_02725 [Planctomycetota bacterium]
MLDLASPWTGRAGDVSAAFAAMGRSPVERLTGAGALDEAPGVRVERTFVSPGRPWACYAIVDGKLVRPGESVRGADIRAILSDRVLLGGATPIEVPVERGK